MIFLELVPRDFQNFLVESQQLLLQFSALTGINVPDVSRLDTRSHDAAGILQDHRLTAIPHIRASDRSVSQAEELVSVFIQRGGKSVLVVNGDEVLGKTQSGVSSIQLISALKRSFPHLTVYAALDPYRQSLQQELTYCQEKLNAGADGVFTQPFFDVKLAEFFLEQLVHTQVFLGTSPVLTEKSIRYWKERNHVVFPPYFQIDTKTNVKLSADLIRLTQQFGQHAYVMPITCDASVYLREVFTCLKGGI